ncbi:hypothetical protein MS5N3_14370 [Marinobacter salsuginis]|uniref:Uncharacterized protein n=1 Tax=Marinobacter salsuginis TaxID=418719 RepID=A0A5M3PML9_9GAMM|nr:hypothetical protein MS5N3_14370 [Marinobacter salsuginis]
MSAAMDGRRQAHMDVLVAVSGKPFLPSPKLQTKQARNLEEANEKFSPKHPQQPNPNSRRSQ